MIMLYGFIKKNILFTIFIKKKYHYTVIMVNQYCSPSSLNEHGSCLDTWLLKKLGSDLISYCKKNNTKCRLCKSDLECNYITL